MRKSMTAIIAYTHLLPLAYDPGKPGWKVENGAIVMKDGNPVYIQSDGSEMVVEQGTISRLNGEAKSYREERDTAKNELATMKKTYEKITDPEAALKAIDMVSKLDQKKLIDAGEVEKVRSEIEKSFKDQIAERDSKLTEQQGKIDKMTLDSAFGASSFVKEKIAVPEDMFRAQFAQHFKVEEGKVVPYDATGTKIFSKTRAGEVANFDEAVEILVNNYQFKDSILKAENHKGTGNNGNGGRGTGTGRTIKRADFNNLAPAQQSEHAQLAAKGELNIVD
jgi:hypothetical protein